MIDYQKAKYLVFVLVELVVVVVVAVFVVVVAVFVVVIMTIVFVIIIIITVAIPIVVDVVFWHKMITIIKGKKLDLIFMLLFVWMLLSLQIRSKIKTNVIMQ